MSDSFGRVVKVRVFATAIDDGTEIDLASDFVSTTGPAISYSQGYTEFSSIQKDDVRGFRIKGQCVQAQPVVGYNSNQITLSMYNLGPDSRALLQSRIGTRIEILAGYGTFASNNAKQIALGDILWARTTKEGPDYITEVIAADGHFALVNGTINLPFKGQVNYTTVVDALFANLENFGLARGVTDIPAGGYQLGKTLSGSPLDLLANLARKMNRSMSIVNGTIHILPTGADAGLETIEVSQATGMVGIPEIQPPGNIGVVPTSNLINPELDMTFTHLLRPELVLHQKIRMTSKFINGEYVILRNVISFDSWSGPFYNKCECQKVITNGQ